jgi:hypothetical protein
MPYKTVNNNPYKTQVNANNYVKSQGILMPNNQVVLMKPLYVFKKVRQTETGDSVIANMIIPVGAFVNLAQTTTLKFRASEALCYSLIKQYSKKPVKTAYSGHDSQFKYKSAIAHGVDENDIELAISDYAGKIRNDKSYVVSDYVYTPKQRFDPSISECRSGIHFFLKPEQAVDYI